MTLEKNFIIILLLIFLSSCGFTPLYKDGASINLKIQVNVLTGDRSTYNLISSNLNRYSFNEAEKTAQIDINTVFEKNILAKDSTGKTTDYQIKITATFDIDIENLKKKIILTESFDYKSFAKNFEELQYEETIKQNISNIISRKLMNQLSRF
tara:strand:- start:124 stop:582 length:459 start_codon:yes stop_codon:yes gene_type:complete